MTSPVGSARIEIIGNEGAWAANVDETIQAGMAKAAASVDAIAGEMTASMAAAGAAAGSGWTTDASGRIRDSRGKFVSATRIAAAGAEEEMAASGSRAGRKFSGAAQTEMQAAAIKSGTKFTETLNKVLGTSFSGKQFGAAAAAAVVVGAVKMAGDFQTQMTRLVTAAGESESAMSMVSSGSLKIARDTGTSTKEIASGMYMIESAGFHGADALNVMKAAAQGAKVDMADTGTVADALTTAMTDLHAPTDKASTVMSQLVATVGHGKMTMEDLAGSLHSVLPNAAAMGLSMGQVGGAIATMTAQGISANQATQNLNHTIISLANPTAVQTKAMAAFGLNATDVAKNIGKNGLDGTLRNLSETILRHMGPAGLTVENVMNHSSVAADKANRMFAALAPAIQPVVKAWVDGKITAKEYAKGMSTATQEQRNLASQYLVSEKRAHGFNDLLKSGSPDALTYAGAMAKMTGGSVGLQVALHLTGENMKTYQANVKGISAAQAEAGNNVRDWATKQATFNQQMDVFKETIATATISLGLIFLPAAQKLVTVVNQDVVPAMESSIEVIKENRAWLLPLAAVLGTVYLAFKAVELAQVAGRAVSIAYGLATGALTLVQGENAVVNGETAAATTLNTAAANGYRMAALVASAATKVWTGVQIAFNAVMDGNPIALIIIGLIALAAGVVYAYTHFKVFRDIVADVGHALMTGLGAALTWTKNAVGDVVDFIRDHWRTLGLIFLAVLAPVIFMVVEVVRHFGEIETAVRTVGAAIEQGWNATWAAVTGAWADVVQAWDATMNAVTGAWQAAWGAVTAVWDAVWPTIRTIGLIIYAILGGTVLLAIWTVKAEWAVMWAVMSTVWTAVGRPILTAVETNVTAMWSAVKLVIGLLTKGWHDTMTGLDTAWSTVGKPAVNAVTTAAAAVWAAVQITFAKIGQGWDDLWSGAQQVWAVTGEPVVNGVETAVSASWDAVKVTWGHIAGAWDSLWSGAKIVWDRTGHAAISGVTSTVENVWKNFLKPTFGHIADGWSNLWNGAGAVFTTAWGGVESAISTSIGGVVRLLNEFVKGINAILSKLPGGFSIPLIPWDSSTAGDAGVPRPAGPPPSKAGFNAGGIVPGSGNGDTYAAWLTPGEGVLNKQAMKWLGTDFVHQVNNRFGGPSKTGGTIFAGGGIAGIVKGAVSSVIGAGRDVAGLAVGAGLNAVESPLRAAMGAIPSQLLRTIGLGLLAKMNAGAQSFISGHQPSTSGGSAGGAVTGDHMALIAKALGLAGVAATAGNIADVNQIVTFESGWNPNAINLTDSNAAAGHPSQGLMQTIPSTFNAYALPGLGGITDPIANMVAGIRYAVSRYGDLDNVPGIRAVHAGGHYVGYDNGGILRPGVTVAHNTSGVNEHVLTGRQMDDLVAALEAPMRLVDINGTYIATVVNTSTMRKERGA